MQALSADQLMERLGRGEIQHLIHVLPRQSFEKKRLPYAVHASLYEGDFLERIEELVEDKQEPIVVYCTSASCNASEKAAVELTRAGYGQVFDFEGGLKGVGRGRLSLGGRQPSLTFQPLLETRGYVRSYRRQLRLRFA